MVKYDLSVLSMASKVPEQQGAVGCPNPKKCWVCSKPVMPTDLTFGDPEDRDVHLDCGLFVCRGDVNPVFPEFYAASERFFNGPQAAVYQEARRLWVQILHGRVDAARYILSRPVWTPRGDECEHAEYVFDGRHFAFRAHTRVLARDRENARLVLEAIPPVLERLLNP